MLKNYFTIAFRNIFKQKSYSFINIAGLAIGMASCILILLWVMDELSYDRFNKNADNIYRVVENQYYAGDEIFPVAVTPGPLAKYLKDEYPDIINSCRVTFITQSLRYSENTFTENILLADSSFLEMFTFPLIKGDIKNALIQPYSIVLSERASGKFFGEKDPIGQSLTIGSDIDLQVTGVFKNVPENSHLRFDYIIPFKILVNFGNTTTSWSNNSYYTFVQLQNDTNFKTVNEKIKDTIKKNSEESSTDIYLQPLVDIHLYSGSKYTADIGGHGNIEYVKIFSLVAIFILLIACINFMNLATARSERRAKEVGLRKVVGAMRFQIIKQFFVESIIITFAALLIALFFVNLFLPAFNELAGKTINFWDSSSAIYSGLLILVVLTGVVAGSYPAIYLSSFVPAKILKVGTTSDKKGSRFRKVLVVIQFTLSIFLIISTTIIYNQLDYIQNKNLGFQKENIVFSPLSSKVREKIETVKAELLNNPNIISASASNSIPTYYGNSQSGIEWEGKNPDDQILMHFVSVDDNYLETFNMKLAEGRFFSKEFVSDTNAVVVNETAAKIMGMSEPVGKRLTISDIDFTIIGITKDFHFKKLDTKIEPLVLIQMPKYNNILFIRFKPDDIFASMSFIKSMLKEFDPARQFDFKFLDEQFDQLYKSEQRMGELFTSFSILAIIISCLGLFGLASYMAERKTKEIGVRKVMGASIFNITLLLTNNFSKLVLLANLIAWPLAFYFASSWLESFVYRIDITLWPFLISALLAILIAVTTVSYQSIKAAVANPVDSLRSE